MTETDTILTNSDATVPIKGVSITPPMTGTYTCTIEMWSGSNCTVTSDVRFYSVRCGWLKGNNEVITEADLK